MYQFSRAIYRELAPQILPAPPGQPESANHTAVLRACEAVVTRLAIDRHHCRCSDLASRDISPSRRPQDGYIAHGAGSDTQSSVEAPESGTRGCFQHSTGNDTMIIE